MFMGFGSFLEGMRLSQSDIEDKKKAELNKRYIESQMSTMDLSRRMNEDELNYRPTERGYKKSEFDRTQYEQSLKDNLFPIIGGLDSEQSDPLAAGNDAITQMNALREKHGLGRLNIAGVRPVREDTNPGGDDNRSQVVGYELYNDEGKGVSGVLKGREALANTMYRLAGEHPEWVDTENKIKAARAYNGGATAPKFEETPQSKAARATMNNAQRELAAFEQTTPSALLASNPAMKARHEELINKANQAQEEFNAILAAQGSTFNTRGQDDPEAILPAEVLDGIRSGRYVVVDKDTAKALKPAPAAKKNPGGGTGKAVDGRVKKKDKAGAGTPTGAAANTAAQDFDLNAGLQLLRDVAQK